MEVLPEIMERRVVIDDRVVNTESNLKPAILGRILYRVGLDHHLYDRHEHAINKLIKVRNSIAHGESMSGVSRERCEQLRDIVFDVMRDVRMRLRECVRCQVYLRQVSA